MNCAPFSFFNAVGYAPPVVALGLEQWDDGREKDTGMNIRRSGEFVVNLVDEALAEKMNLAAIDFPEEVDEFAEVGLTPAPSVKIGPPGIAGVSRSFGVSAARWSRLVASTRSPSGRLCAFGSEMT